MSTWTSNSIVAIAAALALTGCGGGGLPLLDRSASSSTTGGTVPSSISVADGAVTLSAPSGFCVDKASSQATAQIPFVMFGNCAAVSKNKSAAQPDHKAVLTASVGPVDSGGSVAGSADQLSSYFRSAEGRQLLSREGDANSVSVSESFEENGVFYLRASDSSSGPLPGLAADQWRAYFDVNGRLISTAVLGFKDDPMTSEESLSILKNFTSSIKRESSGAPRAPAPVAEPVPTTNTNSGRDLGGVGLLRRILG